MSSTQIILLERVEKLGVMGDVVNVKPVLPVTIFYHRRKLYAQAKPILHISKHRRSLWKPIVLKSKKKQKN